MGSETDRRRTDHQSRTVGVTGEVRCPSQTRPSWDQSARGSRDRGSHTPRRGPCFRLPKAPRNRRHRQPYPGGVAGRRPSTPPPTSRGLRVSRRHKGAPSTGPGHRRWDDDGRNPPRGTCTLCVGRVGLSDTQGGTHRREVSENSKLLSPPLSWTEPTLHPGPWDPGTRGWGGRSDAGGVPRQAPPGRAPSDGPRTFVGRPWRQWCKV